jgi:hypothetical protein
MEVIHGLTAPEICKRNVVFTWSIFWPRVVALYSIREPCSWTIATAYHKFYSDKTKHHQAINTPALTIDDVPILCTEPSVAWLSATSLSTTASAALPLPAKQGRLDVGRPRNSAVRQRNEAQDAASLIAATVPFIPPCVPSLLPQVSRHDDWDAAAYVSASKEARYKCPYPTCEEHFGSTSGIRSHWKATHVDVAVPEITAARTRIRVDASDAVQASRNSDTARAASLAAEGQQWRDSHPPSPSGQPPQVSLSETAVQGTFSSQTTL